MLGSKMVVMLLVIDHVRRGEMTESRRILVQTCRHHGCDWWNMDRMPAVVVSTAKHSFNSRFRSSIAAEESQLKRGPWENMSGGGKRQGWHVEDAQHWDGDMSSKMSKSYAGQLSNGLLLTTAVHQGTHIAGGSCCLRLDIGS